MKIIVKEFASKFFYFLLFDLKCSISNSNKQLHPEHIFHSIVPAFLGYLVPESFAH